MTSGRPNTRRANVGGGALSDRQTMLLRINQPSAFLTSRSFTIPGGMSGGRLCSRSGR